MAKKKKENTLQYLQMPLPTGSKYSKMTKISFGGLNKRYTIDSGELSMVNNISTSEYPYLTPSELKKPVIEGYSNPISLFAFDDFLMVVYRENEAIKVDYIKEDYKYTGVIKSSGATPDDDYPRCIIQFNVYDTPTDPLTGQFVKKLLIFPDKMSMFMKIEEAHTNPTTWTTERFASASQDVLYHYNGSYFTIKTENGGYVVKANGENGRFAPESMSVQIKSYHNATSEVDKSGATIYPPPETANRNYYYKNTYKHQDTNFGTDIYRWCEYETAVQDKDGNWVPDGGTAEGWKVCVAPAMPNLKYATVHLSRVFGVDDDRVYASGYNDYTNWNLDTAGEYNESNSWCSPSQSNTKAGGKFTGITTFDSHVICFKKDFMHEIYNTKNPFRLQDIYAEGCIDNRTIQNVDGKLIFVSEDDVKRYTGSNPRIIGFNLNMPQYTYAVSGTDNRNYYLYCEDADENTYLYVYDTFTELWSEQSISYRVLSFAHNKNGMYMLCDNGKIYKLDSNQYKHSWSFETELITSQTVNIKHIKKLQLLVDIPEKINEQYNFGDDDGTPADMRMYILYDDENFDEMSPSKKAQRLVYTSKKYGKFPIRVKPRKTANYGFKLHFEGTGYAKLYELEIFIEAGGAMYV